MRRVHSCLLLFALAGSATAQPERTHDITPDDYFTVNTITEIALSPDGKTVAYCLATWNEAINGRQINLWSVPTDGKGKPTQLTKDGTGYRHPKWSADGKAVYVMANRRGTAAKGSPGGAQVWKVPLEGEAELVTKAIGGVIAFDYAPKADAIFYSVDASATDEDDFTKLRTKFPAPEYGSGKRKVSEVFRLDAGSGKIEKVIAEKRYVREFAVTADGKRVGMVTAVDDTVIRSEGDSRVDVWDAESGKSTTTDQSWKKTAGSPWPWLESVAWNPDGTKLAYCTIFDGYPTEVIVCEAKNGAWPAKRMPRPAGVHVRGYGTPLKWYNADSFGYFAERAGKVDSLSFDLKINKTHIPPEWFTRVEYAWDYTPNPQTRVTVAATDRSFPALYAVQDNGEVEILNPNPHAKTWKLPSVEHITWRAPDGATAGGPLELPYGYKKGEKKLPLVVAIHGGPTTASHADLEFDPHNGRLYFSAKGYAVLCPNYRGSTGYGDKFVTDLIGNENDIEVRDILAGIQHLVTEGIVDPDQVAVMGWSNGGYLTNCLITLKNPPVRFKAASSGGCIVDTVAEWGFNDEPAYPRVFKKGLPWETPDVYRKTSPTYGLGNVTTPTIIHVGGSDDRCPPGHSRMLHRALKEYVNVPTELVVYPNEPHGLTKYSNRKAKMEWDLAWFDKYVLGK
ncbi:MAG TPA: prolyl oligopeptidase family serine peptidase [Gemmataceae bacterium]|nr:prolyl oligopeptidase family serine peptidase [Gemmataceae bacterium]